MPFIRQGLGSVILELNGMANSRLPNWALTPLARAIDRDEWIGVGVAKKSPVDCKTGAISYTPQRYASTRIAQSFPTSKESEVEGGEQSAIVGASEASNKETVRGETPRAFVELPVAGRDKPTCCQLVDSETSPYVRPIYKRLHFAASASVPGLAEIKFEVDGRRNAAVLEPDFTHNCPASCRDDRVIVPVSVDYNVQLHVSGWIELGQHPPLVTPDGQGGGSLYFGPMIGNQGTLHIEQEGLDVTGFKIGFDFRLQVVDGIVIRFEFDCERGTYLGVPPLNNSDEVGSPSPPSPGGSSVPMAPIFPVQCDGVFYLLGVGAPHPPLDTRWRFTFVAMNGNPILLEAETDAFGVFILTRPGQDDELPLPHELWNGKISNACGNPQPFHYEIKVERFGATPAVGRTTGPLPVACPDDAPEPKTFAAQVSVGNTNITFELAVFSQCINNRQ